MMNEDIRNAISTDDPELHDRIIKTLSSVGDIATICIMYEKGEISGKVAIDATVGKIVDLGTMVESPTPKDALHEWKVWMCDKTLNNGRSTDTFCYMPYGGKRMSCMGCIYSVE